MPKLTAPCAQHRQYSDKEGKKKKLTPQILGAHASRQRAICCTSKLIRVKLRIKSMFIKVHVEHPCTGVYGRPRHNDRLAVNALTHNVKRLAWAAEPVVLVGVITPVSARRDNVLAHELPDASGPDNVPNRDRAGGVDSERVHAVAK